MRTVLVDNEAARACLQALSRRFGHGGCLCGSPERIAELAPAGAALVAVDADRRIVLFNERACELTGLSAEAALGHRCSEAIPCPDCATRCGLFDDGEICGKRCEIGTAAMGRIPVFKTGWALRDPTGRLVGGIERLQRVAARNEDGELEELRARCRLLESASETLDDALLLLDSRGCIELLSARAAVLLGISPDAAGAELASVVDDASRLLAAIEAAAQAGEPMDVSGLRAVHAGRGSLVRARVTSVEAPHGGRLGAWLSLTPDAPPSQETAFHGLHWRSPAMRRLIECVVKLAQSAVPVLLTGESGVGKELVARALHLAGPRRTRPFHAVNCAALSEALLESELFGHDRGAFTGAHQAKPGRLELCADGTLLLDEVACLAPATQAKLLRVLEAREFERVGGTRTLRLGARVIAATNIDLGPLVERGQFREDLYYRLRVLPVQVPPLRCRREDIPLLAAHFARQVESGVEVDDPAFTAAALATLIDYDWPGNVRELRNAVQYALLMGDGRRVRVTDLPSEIRRGAARRAPGSSGEIEQALKTADYRRGRAASLLGISRTTLWRRMRRP